MREYRKCGNAVLNPAVKFAGALIVLGILLLCCVSAVRFCLSLFLVGDYVVTLPGAGPEVIYNPTSDGQKPGGSSDQTSEFVYETARANILLAGDLMAHLPVVRSGKTGSTYNFNYIFTHVAPYISRADYAIADLETTFAGTEDGKEYTGSPHFNSPDALASAAKQAGFDMLLTGNNHCYDYGTSGLKRTLQVIGNAGLDTLGTTAKADDLKYAVKTINGIKVGMISYTFADIGADLSRPTLNKKTVDSAGAGLINVFDYKQLDLFYQEMENQISAMRASGAEFILLNIHWGDDYKMTVTDTQRGIAQKMCDLGVDLIAGTHPHLVQPMELLTSSRDASHKTVCVYSLGTFLSNLRADTCDITSGHTEDSTLLTFSLVKYNTGLVAVETVELQPVWVLLRGSGNDRTYHILPLDYSVSNWDAAYNLSAQQLEKAKASYNRTMDIVGTKLKEVQSALASLKAAREESFGGVGVG